MQGNENGAVQRQGWRRLSNMARMLGGSLAVAGPLAAKDWRGAAQCAASIAIANGSAKLLKRRLPELRPDGTDRKSYPSEHTAEAFATATALTRRYGRAVGLPALGLAALIGYARVRAGRHWWHDVAAGACVGIGAGLSAATNVPLL